VDSRFSGTAKVFIGSSNLSVTGEEKNGDNMVMIEDPRVATSYAIEALRIFDHLHFRTIMQKASKKKGGDFSDLTQARRHQRPACLVRGVLRGRQPEGKRSEAFFTLKLA